MTKVDVENGWTLEKWLSTAKKQVEHADRNRREREAADAKDGTARLDRAASLIREAVARMLPKGFPEGCLFVDRESIETYYRKWPLPSREHWPFGGVRLPNGGEVRLYACEHAEGQWFFRDFTDQFGGYPFKVLVPKGVELNLKFSVQFEERSFHDFLEALDTARMAGDALPAVRAEVDRLNSDPVGNFLTPMLRGQ
jgi:hypothetical protein